MAYVKDETPRGRGGEGDCPFCLAPGRTATDSSLSDSEGLIVHRGKTAYVLMNLFPYNSAHLLVCPYVHISEYTDAGADVRSEIAELTAIAIEALKLSFNPDGFNVGLNQGEVAGAGIAAHLHQHIVPRWLGDANFFAITAGTRAVPTLLEEGRSRIANVWQEAENIIKEKTLKTKENNG